MTCLSFLPHSQLCLTQESQPTSPCSVHMSPQAANPLDPLKSGGAESSSIVHPQKGWLSLMMDPGKEFMQTLKVNCGLFRQGIWKSHLSGVWSRRRCCASRYIEHFGLTDSLPHGIPRRGPKWSPSRLCYPIWQPLITRGFWAPVCNVAAPNWVAGNELIVKCILHIKNTVQKIKRM